MSLISDFVYQQCIYAPGIFCCCQVRFVLRVVKGRCITDIMFSKVTAALNEADPIDCFKIVMNAKWNFVCDWYMTEVHFSDCVKTLMVKSHTIEGRFV